MIRPQNSKWLFKVTYVHSFVCSSVEKMREKEFQKLHINQCHLVVLSPKCLVTRDNHAPLLEQIGSCKQCPT